MSIAGYDQYNLSLHNVFDKSWDSYRSTVKNRSMEFLFFISFKTVRCLPSNSFRKWRKMLKIEYEFLLNKNAAQPHGAPNQALKLTR